MTALERAAALFREAHAAHIEALRAWPYPDQTPDCLPTEIVLDDARRALLTLAIEVSP